MLNVMFFASSSHPVITIYDEASIYSRVLQQEGSSSGISLTAISFDENKVVVVAGQKGGSPFISSFAWDNFSAVIFHNYSVLY